MLVRDKSMIPFKIIIKVNASRNEPTHPKPKGLDKLNRDELDFRRLEDITGQ